MTKAKWGTVTLAACLCKADGVHGTQMLYMGLLMVVIRLAFMVLTLQKISRKETTKKFIKQPPGF
jgi:hypothetical protein